MTTNWRREYEGTPEGTKDYPGRMTPRTSFVLLVVSGFLAINLFVAAIYFHIINP